MLNAQQVASLSRALPFWLSLTLIPLAWIGAFYGGWTVALLPLATWYLFSGLDAVLGLNTENADPNIGEEHLAAYSLITKIWIPLQFITLFGLLYYVPRAEHLEALETVVLFFGVGVITGTVGINYSHELMHQKNKFERWLGDILLSMVLYSHFRTEHLLVHHRYVGTPRDAVTARYNEGFYRYFPRVLREGLSSAFKAEKEMLARKDLPWSDTSNPFFRYWALQAAMLVLALIVGGWMGLALFLWQAFSAVWQLELVNYIEHYGLTRKHLGDGKYEHVMPHHSWNAAHKASNWLLINLQRHSDHHYKPDRRFPLLQNYDAAQAPQLPYGYPLMTMAAMVPPLWRKKMNPRVRKWREMYYPEITEWKPYNKATNPMPR
ncbi:MULTISPECIES: alkane 1-monooxygenase [Lentibacter]|jgi:alkane 1-monooxygenase|uniref:Alkane 1-monooxygenase n=1 Tax=Lentibacter algarum TaxID=576131 RepID=A0A1H3MHF2_9RHOB|nr:alkane 1-monooxygenase [Lentibacter algarum]MCO4829166.1 alkane 1-monooxygenase [Lentibacter algarum]WIF33121.1 putative fatty acid desaturase [Lentibacter algarum]SDY75778.1 alkane 1-monooxygenase [Lentibacter algarum]